MAELILSPIADNIIGSLGSAAVQEIAALWGVNEDLQELQTTISLIRAVLRDAEKKQVHNNGVREWMRSLADVVHDADDLMDEFDTEALRRQSMDGNEVAKKVCTFFSASNQLAFRHKLGRRIQEIRKKLALASNDRSFLLLEARSSDEESEVSRKRETHSFVPQEEVVGRDEEREAIVKLLLECRFDENVAVIPIVGMGGLGKTALVQCVFNEKRVQQHFDLKIWACVSENFNLKEIIQTITQSQKVKLDQLQQDLREMLGGKQYLLVLDDVWEESREKWLELKNLLICGAKGSRVVVTTRSTVVASVTSPIDSYHLGVLDEEKSWSLFAKMAFRQEQEKKDPNLIAIGKEIAKKCRGIPLVIKAIGNTLYCKQSVSEWSSFYKEFSEVTREVGTILPTLKLSYDNLPSHLKPCLSYCILFPKDYRIEVKLLIELWMAQGFLKLANSGRDQCLEDVGYRYFLDLFERSFFQEIEVDLFGAVESFKVHDLIHDLITEVAGLEYATYSSHSIKIISRSVRHLSFGEDIGPLSQTSISLLHPGKIRTLISIKKCVFFEKQGTMASNFMQLRALDLRASLITIVPRYVDRLKHVRYLDLSSNYTMKTLPNSISNLVNLQTLKLNFCFFLLKLPLDMKMLVNLRHLEIDGCNSLRHMPIGMSQITKLTTLSMYVLPERTDPSIKHRGELRELMGLNGLRGELKISNLRHGDTQAESANLKEKQHLRSLHLKWEDTTVDTHGYEMSLDSLQPHSSLQELTLENYGGRKLAGWIPSLANLVSLKLSSCKNCMYLFPMNQFLNLKRLEVSCLPSLEYITDENIDHDLSGSPSLLLPSLKKLSLNEMPKLKGWWRKYEEFDKENQHKRLPFFPQLARLDIRDCPNLMCMPLYPNLEELSLRETSLEPFRKTVQELGISKLNNLQIGGIDGLECLPLWFKSLSSLQKLTICNCSPTMNLCPGILHLTSLTDLALEKADLCVLDADEFAWKALAGRLKTLSLVGFKTMKTLPEGIQHLASLQSLTILWAELTTIPEWISNYSSLKILKLLYCHKLVALPEAIRDLVSLEELSIIGCPILWKRCQREIGSDWPKIAHIPRLRLLRDNTEDSDSGGCGALTGCFS